MRIDFYILKDNANNAFWLLVCRLLEKAYLKGRRIFVFCNNQSDAHYLDELLWTFKEDSFIPHNLQGEGPEPPPPVQIGFSEEPRGYNDILINLSETIPPFHVRFQRIIELVSPNETAKILSRNHYKFYKQQQYELFTHELQDF